jgi:hypothetical protein
MPFVKAALNPQERHGCKPSSSSLNFTTVRTVTVRMVDPKPSSATFLIQKTREPLLKSAVEKSNNNNRLSTRLPYIDLVYG